MIPALDMDEGGIYLKLQLQSLLDVMEGENSLRMQVSGNAYLLAIHESRSGAMQEILKMSLDYEWRRLYLDWDYDQRAVPDM